MRCYDINNLRGIDTDGIWKCFICGILISDRRHLNFIHSIIVDDGQGSTNIQRLLSNPIKILKNEVIQKQRIIR